MRPVFADVRAVRLAGKVRWCRETLGEVGCGLAEIGRDDLLFELTNLELQLHELHLELMQPMRKLAPPTPRQERANGRAKPSRIAHAPVTRRTRIP